MKSINATTHNDLKPALQAGPTLTNAEECQRRLSVSVHAGGEREWPERTSPCFAGNKRFAESVNDG